MHADPSRAPRPFADLWPVEPPRRPAAPAVVVYGPPGCGKSHHAQAIAAHYDLEAIVDGWSPGDEIRPHALHLTTLRPPMLPQGVYAIEFAAALAVVNVAGHRHLSRNLPVIPAGVGARPAPYRATRGAVQ